MSCGPRRLAIGFFFASIMTFFITIVNFNSWCPENDQLQLQDKELNLYKGRLKVLNSEIISCRKILKKLSEDSNNYPVNQMNLDSNYTHFSTIYAITPTHTRPEQKADLTRLSYALRFVRNFHWILIEDSEEKTELVMKFLSKSHLNYTHLSIPTPEEYKMKSRDPNWLKPRGVLQRNLGLNWIRQNLKPDEHRGVVYFMDDDNTYDIEIFEEMRNTKKVSVWPVALVGDLRYESPVVVRGKVNGWFTFWKPERPFAMDMAGFAVNLDVIFSNPDAWFSLQVQRGYQESSILTSLGVKMQDLEPKAQNCTKILVWHTRTEKTKLKNEELMRRSYGRGSNLNMEI
ncbi:hypothetical protein ScPMuIL_014625 [Solemya velum]